MQVNDKEQLKILLLEGVDPVASEVFQEMGYTNVEYHTKALSPEELEQEIQNAQVVGIRSKTLITKDVLEKAENLLAIGCFCIGTNNVDLEAVTQHGVAVFNAPHASTRSVAELTIGMTIMLLRDIIKKNRLMHEGGWPKTTAGSHEIRGKAMGIVGYGHIGSQVSILAEALGMKVYYYDIVRKLSLGNAQSVDSLEELLKISDIVTLHVPETPQTKLMMTHERLELMKEGSCLINLSRGSVVDIDALNKCLESHKIKGAALDVFPVEPKTLETPFESVVKGKETVVLTPHIGGATMEAQRNIGLEVSHKVASYLDSGSTDGSVNFPNMSLPLYKNAHRMIHIHRNIPGMLKQINKAVADMNINVQSQYLLTNAEIGYVVMDIEKQVSNSLQKALSNIEGTISCRTLF